VKELVYTAFDASATHLYVPGLRQHVKNALAHGATPGEIMEVFELASTIGIQACAVALPILADELERVG
jgi:alkylhydroperoxidase/carboxymuconolactone decarboxylase family protein YurZ